MEQKIKEVQEYFKSKMLKGKFEPIEFKDSTLRIEIDSKYRFGFYVFSDWVSNTSGVVQITFDDAETKIVQEMILKIASEFKQKAKIEAFNKLALELGKEPIAE